MIFRFSDGYYPPAPVVEVTLMSAAKDTHVGPLRGFVDSGADGTIIPLAYLEELGAPVTAQMLIRSWWGERREVLMYLVDVQIGNLVLPGIQVVGDELADEIVVGRDILNRFRVVLDGPRGMIEISAAT